MQPCNDSMQADIVERQTDAADDGSIVLLYRQGVGIAAGLRCASNPRQEKETNSAIETSQANRRSNFPRATSIVSFLFLSFPFLSHTRRSLRNLTQQSVRPHPTPTSEGCDGNSPFQNRNACLKASPVRSPSQRRQRCERRSRLSRKVRHLVGR